MRFFLVALAFAVIAASGLAQSPAPAPDIGATLDAQTDEITAAGVELTQDAPDLTRLREDLLDRRRESLRLRETLTSEREQVLEDLDRLGEFIEGEAEGVTERRTRLQRARETLDAQTAQAGLNADEAMRLLGEIAELRRARFYSNVFQRTGTPVLPRRLADAADASGQAAAGVRTGITAWVEARETSGGLTARLSLVGAALVFALLMAIPVRNWIQRRVTHRIEKLEPLGSRRILAATSKAISRAAPAIIGGFVLYQAIILVGLVGPSGTALLQQAWIGIAVIILVDGATTAVFSPRSPAWRIFSVSDRGAFWIRSFAIGIAAVMAVDGLLRGMVALSEDNVEVGLTLRGLAAIVLGALILTQTRAWAWRLPAGDAQATSSDTEDQAHGRHASPSHNSLRKWISPVGIVLGGGVVAASLVGYPAAAHFVATRAVHTIALIAVAMAVRALLREGVRTLDSRFRSSKSTANDSERLLFFWVGTLVDVIVISAALPVLFLLYGSDWADVRAVIQDALFGFEIGNVRISILQILASIGLFALLLAVTRFVQRTAETRIFPKTRMDIGVQNSLKTLIGYIGLVIAFMTGVGMLGFDLSNLAIIAGALSVGIGFGLQSIVNNFVSGLILLFERPIKVGDWIVTTSGEGIVKRISVRSTEIETFDRASIIVPNSELISSSVTNWTHKNKLGRVRVAVGVSYNEDPDRIIEILNGIPKKVDIILNFPPPITTFNGFGDSSLDFEIRAFVSDVSNSLIARTALRVAIFKAFREAGVEIPFPQRDLHLRSAVALAAVRDATESEEA
ncbi:MAG: DUF3772 domain-containing protein [Pseudomonadota bacterium]